MEQGIVGKLSGHLQLEYNNEMLTYYVTFVYLFKLVEVQKSLSYFATINFKVVYTAAWLQNVFNRTAQYYEYQTPGRNINRNNYVMGKTICLNQRGIFELSCVKIGLGFSTGRNPQKNKRHKNCVFHRHLELPPLI
jgi:hypothetical protein